MKRKVVYTLFFLAFSTPSWAEPDKMKMVNVWTGNYKHTVVYLLEDVERGVMCYILAPKLLEHKVDMWETVTIASNNAGSISCLKMD